MLNFAIPTKVSPDFIIKYVGTHLKTQKVIQNLLLQSKGPLGSKSLSEDDFGDIEDDENFLV